MRFVITVVVLLILSGVAIVGFSSIQASSQTELTAIVIDTSAAEASIEGFERAYDIRPITFPEDLGPHPTFQTEWWYYTGNLADQRGNRFGFQLTFFSPSVWNQMRLNVALTGVAIRYILRTLVSPICLIIRSIHVSAGVAVVRIWPGRKAPPIVFG